MSALQLVETEGGRPDRLAKQERAALHILSHLDEILPPLDRNLVGTLAQSMRDVGYFRHEPVVVFKLPGGQVVTIIGRHRQAAAAEAGIEAGVVEFGGDAVEAVYRMMASTLQRRDLTMGQRTAISRRMDNAGWDWDQIARDRGLRIPREQIEAVLIEQAGLDRPLTHRAIAKLLRMEAHASVDRACARLVEEGRLESCPHAFTEAGRQAPGRRTMAPRPPTPTPEPKRPMASGEERLAALDDRIHPDREPEPLAPVTVLEPRRAAPVIELRPPGELAELDAEIRRRLLAGEPTLFRELAQRFGVGAALVQNRIQFCRGFLAARQPDPGCTHGCPAHCPES